MQDTKHVGVFYPLISSIIVWMEQNHPRVRYPALLFDFLINFLNIQMTKKKCHKMLQDDFWGVFGGGPDFRQF